MIKAHLLLIPVFGMVASAFGQLTNPPPVPPIKGSFLGRWSRTHMTLGGKEVQTLRVISDNKFSFVSVDENGKKINQYGSWKSSGDTLSLMVSPKRGGTRFDQITFHRTDPATVAATRWNLKIWGPGPIIFSYVGGIERVAAPLSTRAGG
jgi:hypothetical protein